MKLKFLPFLLVSITACTQSAPSGKTETLASSVKREIIESLMAEQEEAWNNGNLEDFMQHYFQSDSLVFIGSRGLNYGWNTTLENYQKSYPDKEAMGTLHFDNLEFKDLGDEYSFMIGRWNLYRTSDTLSGSYSLLWKWDGKTAEIIADHSS